MSADLVLASPLVATILGTLGLGLVFLASWINAVDVALSRMSLAYAEDLEEEGRKGAPQLASALETRRETALALLLPRSFAQTLGILLLSVTIVSQMTYRGAPWWLNLLLTILIIAVIEGTAVVALAAMLSGDRYVWVALRGAPLADRLLRRTSALAALGKGSERRARREPTSARLAMVEELRELVDEVAEGDHSDLDADDREILRSVFELGQTRVGELMVPRGEMVVARADDTAGETVALFLSSGFSRVPVIGKNTDDVVGVLYFKDVVRRVFGPNGSDSVVATEMMRPASFVPEMKLADDELRVMQATNSHLAMVVDEYGGIAGLITAEDILEELVGELTDEHDRAAAVPQQVGQDTWEVPASYSVDDLADLLDAKLDEDDVYSVGGLLGKALGKVPLPGSFAQVGDVLLQAGEDVGRRRQIQTVIVTRLLGDDFEDGSEESPAGEGTASERKSSADER